LDAERTTISMTKSFYQSYEAWENGGTSGRNSKMIENLNDHRKLTYFWHPKI